MVASQTTVYIVILEFRLTLVDGPGFGMSLYRGLQSPFGFPEPTEIQSSEPTNFFGDPDPEIFLASVTLQERNPDEPDRQRPEIHQQR